MKNLKWLLQKNDFIPYVEIHMFYFTYILFWRNIFFSQFCSSIVFGVRIIVLKAYCEGISNNIQSTENVIDIAGTAFPYLEGLVSYFLKGF
jgi:hypothetical protein